MKQTNGAVRRVSLVPLAARALLQASLAATLAQACIAQAAELPDPTRPPLAQRRALPAADQPAARIVPVLQSVMTGAGRKPSVIISGQALELGDSFDGMRLARVTETGALLVGPQGSTTLVLTPAADKQPTASPGSEPGIVTAANQKRGPTPSIIIRMTDTK